MPSVAELVGTKRAKALHTMMQHGATKNDKKRGTRSPPICLHSPVGLPVALDYSRTVTCHLSFKKEQNSERQCSVFCTIWPSRTPFSQQVNGHAPFSKPFSGSKVGGLNRSEWVDMLRFRQRVCSCIYQSSQDYTMGSCTFLKMNDTNEL